MSVIARVWFGKTPLATSEEYLEYVCKTGVKDLIATDGNRGVLVFKRPEDNIAEIAVISFWESVQAIRRFAGDDISKAVYYPEDGRYLQKMEPRLLHFDVPIATNVEFGVSQSGPLDNGKLK